MYPIILLLRPLFLETAQILKIPIDSVYAWHNYLKEKLRDKVKKIFSLNYCLPSS